MSRTYLKPVLAVRVSRWSRSVDTRGSQTRALTARCSLSAWRHVQEEDGANIVEELRVLTTQAGKALAEPVRTQNAALKASASTSNGVQIRLQRPASRSNSSPRSQQQQRQRDHGRREKEESTARSKRTHLPRINGLSSLAVAAAAEGRTSFSRRNPDEEDEEDTSATVHSSRPANVYAASPYRIPPPPAVTKKPSREKRRQSSGVFTSSID